MYKVLLIQFFFLFSLVSSAQVYQFRGPDRDGKFPETGLLKEWPLEGPELLLEYEGVGEGYSSVISNGKYIYTTGMIDTLDYMTCIDFDGNKKWQVAYGESWKQAFPSTRSSPTLEDDRVYVVSGIGELVCLNAETGDINWKVNVDKDYEAEWHNWGVAESPLIVDDKVICTPGGAVTSIIAFDKMTGKEIWKSPSTGGPRSYVSPTLRNFNGQQYLLAATATDLLIVDPIDGQIKLTYKYFDSANWRWQPNGVIWANAPVVKDDMIFLSIGYDYSAKMLKINADFTAIEEVYTNTVLDNHHHGLIELDGYLYGSNWLSNNNGNWVCLNWETGETVYEETWNSKGDMVYADGLLYVYDEKRGNVGLVKPDPAGFKVISSFPITKGRNQHWSHPYIFEGKLFMRHGDVLMIYNLKA